MSKISLSVIFFCFFFICYSQTPNWAWAKTATGKARIFSVAAGNSGNVYSAGDLYPSALVFNSTLTLNFGYTKNMFLTKHDANGNILWARQASATEAIAMGIATDSNENVYMIGNYRSSISLDAFALGGYPNNGTDIVFVAKFDSNGNVLWAKKAGGNYYSNGYSIAVDNNGNVFVTGTFEGLYINFDSITLQNPHQTGTSGSTFIAKYDASGNIL